MKPIEGAIWQVSVPALVVGIVWATAEDATANPISIVAIKDLNMNGFLKYLLQAGLRLHAAMRNAACISITIGSAAEPPVQAGQGKCFRTDS